MAELQHETLRIEVGPHERGEMLIDRALPVFDATLVEHVVIDADVATTWSALHDLDLMSVHTPLMDAAMWVRGLPPRLNTLLGRGAPQAPPPPQLKLPMAGDGAHVEAGLEGWLPLGDTPGQEVAFGAIGRFWQPDIEWYDTTGMTPEAFAAFDEPGWGRIAANLSLRPYGESRTLVSYEARTATPDPKSRRAFARYWRLIRPFAGHIMRAALQALQEDAEHRARA